jgi:hypothetical protein
MFELVPSFYSVLVIHALNLTPVDQVLHNVSSDSSRYSDLLGPPFPNGCRGLINARELPRFMCPYLNHRMERMNWSRCAVAPPGLVQQESTTQFSIVLFVRAP